MHLPRLSFCPAVIVACLFGASVQTWADVSTLNFNVGVIRDRNQNPVAADTVAGDNTGTIGILVASASGNFSSGADMLNSTLSAGNAFGSGDNQIVATFHAELLPLNPGDPTNPQTDTQFATVVNFDTVATPANTKLQLYWFPGITTDGTKLLASSLVSLSLGGNYYYGSYRSDSVDALSDIGWFVPATGSTSTLLVIDQTAQLALLGSNTGELATQNDLSALKYFAIPEPSSVVLLSAGGFLLTGALLRRRRAA